MQPLRCWTCGRSVHGALREFPLREQGEVPPAAVLDRLGLRLYCCRRFPLTDPTAPTPASAAAAAAAENQAEAPSVMADS
jgi:DNA-directed RNA polymerase subunit N (RpoN/RPB10)